MKKTFKNIFKIVLISLIIIFLIYFFAESTSAAEENPYYIEVTDYVGYTKTQVTKTYQDSNGTWWYGQSAKYYYSAEFNPFECELNDGKPEGFWTTGYYVAFYGSWANAEIPFDYEPEKFDISKSYEIYDPVKGGIPAYISSVPVDVPENTVLPKEGNGDDLPSNLIYSKAYKADSKNGKLQACFLESAHGNLLNAEEKKMDISDNISMDISNIRVFYFTGDIYTNQYDWYVIAAKKADNPILLAPSDYYEGVSLDSNVISDLTFMEVPFSSYNNNLKKYGSLIAINEALYKTSDDSQVYNDIVAYVYDPNYADNTNKHPIYNLTFELDRIERLYNGDYADVSSTYMANDNPLGSERWRVIGSYNNILKLKYESKNSSSLNQKSLKELAFNRYSKADVISNKLVFKCTNIERAWYDQSIVEPESYQTIQYIWNYEIPSEVAPLAFYLGASEEEPADDSASSTNSYVSYGTGKVTVEGNSTEYRFDTKQSLWDCINLKDNFSDVFVCYFNVIDNDTGKALTDEYQMNSITLKYYDVLIERNWDNYTLKYLDRTGNIFLTDGPRPNENRVNVESLKPIIQTQTIEPGDVELSFPKDNSKNGWFNYLALSIQGAIFKDSNDRKWKANTLFSTSKQEYLDDLSKASNYSTSEFSGYQFACIYGSLSGYPGSAQTASGQAAGENRHVLEITEYMDVSYNYHGEAYRKEVAHTDIKFISTPHDPNGPDSPFEEIKQENPWKKLVDNIAKFWKKFWQEAKPVMIGLLIIAACIGVGYLIFKVVNYVRISKISRNTSKKE